MLRDVDDTDLLTHTLAAAEESVSLIQRAQIKGW